MRRALAAACLCVGCSATDVSSEVAALRTSVDGQSTNELENVVSSALGGRRVSIADDALTNSSSLIIERAKLRRVEGPPELGRDLGEPEHFRLVRDGNQCFLVHERTDLRWLLADTECMAE